MGRKRAYAREKGKYLLMHSIIYRTKLLHECGMELPNIHSIVNAIFAFDTFVCEENAAYLDVNYIAIGKDNSLCKRMTVKESTNRSR